MKNSYFSSEQKSFFMSVPALVWQMLFLVVPLIVLVVVSFVDPNASTFRFSLINYQSLFQAIYFRIILRSCILAFVTASVCLALAYPVVYWLVFKVRRFQYLYLFLLIVPFWTSLLVQAYAWFFVLEKNGLINTLLLSSGIIHSPMHLLNTRFATYLVMIYCYLPFMILPLYTTLEKLERKLIEASLDLGANPFQTFARVTLPLSISGIKTGFFLVFVPAFGEFVIPALLGGGKRFYIGSLIEHFFLVARDIYSGAAFTVVVGLILVGITYLTHCILNYALAHSKDK